MNAALRQVIAASDDERRDVFLTTARRLGTKRQEAAGAARRGSRPRAQVFISGALLHEFTEVMTDVMTSARIATTV